MTEHRIIKADFADFRRVKGRKVLQLFMEIPLEKSEEALRILGHPVVGESTWVAIAVLDPEATKFVPQSTPFIERVKGEVPQAQPEGQAAHPKKWPEMKRSQQAGLLCSDPDFQSYFSNCGDESMTTGMLKRQLHIESRKDLDNPENHARWDEFVALYQLHRKRHG